MSNTNETTYAGLPLSVTIDKGCDYGVTDLGEFSCIINKQPSNEWCKESGGWLMSVEEQRSNNGGCLTAAARMSASCTYSAGTGPRLLLIDCLVTCKRPLTIVSTHLPLLSHEGLSAA